MTEYNGMNETSAEWYDDCKDLSTSAILSTIDDILNDDDMTDIEAIDEIEYVIKRYKEL